MGATGAEAVEAGGVAIGDAVGGDAVGGGAAAGDGVVGAGAGFAGAPATLIDTQHTARSVSGAAPQYRLREYGRGMVESYRMSPAKYLSVIVLLLGAAIGGYR